MKHQTFQSLSKLNKTELLDARHVTSKSIKLRTGTPKSSGYGKVHSHYKVYRHLVNTCILHAVINPSGETDGNEREKHQIKGEHDIKKGGFLQPRV